MSRKVRYLYLPLGLSFLAGIIYLLTASHAMFWADAPGFADASATLGIYQPAAPLFVSIAHIFSLLPFGSTIFRIQLLSAILASISLFLLYRLILWTGDQIESHETKLKDQYIMFSGIFGVAALAFSYEFWAQAQNTDKYILEVCIELLVLYFILTLLKSQKHFLLLLCTVLFLLGLSLGTDPVVLSFFPAVLFILIENRHNIKVQQYVFLGLSGLLGVTLVSLYLPIASAQHPFLNFGRANFTEELLANFIGTGQNVGANGFTGSLTVFGSSIAQYLYMLWMSFTPLLLPFIILGGWQLWKNVRRLFWIFGLIVATNFVLSVLYLSKNQEAWYLLSYACFAIFAAIGYFWLIQKVQKNWATLVLLVFSLIPLLYWWPTLERHNWAITNDYIENLYSPIKEPAILFGTAAPFSDYAVYNHDMLKYKPDVIPVLGFTLYAQEFYRTNLLTSTNLLAPDVSHYYPPSADSYSAYVNDFFAMNLPKYRIYIDYAAFNTPLLQLPRPDGTATFKLDTNRFKLIPAGLLYEVVTKNSAEQINLQYFNYQFSNNYPENKPVLLERYNNDELNQISDQYAFSYLTIGNLLIQNNNTEEALAYYQKGYAMDPHSGAVLLTLGNFYASRKQPEEALQYFKQGAQSYPDDPSWLLNAAVMDAESGNLTEAVTFLQQVIAHTPVGTQINAQATAIFNKIEQSSK